MQHVIRIFMPKKVPVQPIVYIRKTVGQHTKQLRKIQGTVDQHTKQLGKLQDTVNQHTKQLGKLQDTVDCLDATTGRLAMTVAGLCVRMDRSEEDMLDVKTTVHAIFDRLDGFIASRDKHEVEIASLHMAYERHEERIGVLEKRASA